MTVYTSSNATATFWTTPSNKKYGVRVLFDHEQFVAANSPMSTSTASQDWQGLSLNTPQIHHLLRDFSPPIATGDLEGTIKYTSAADFKADGPSAYKIIYVDMTDEEKAHLLVQIYSIDSAGKESDTYYAEVCPLLSLYVLVLIQFTSSTPGGGIIASVLCWVLARSLLTTVHSRMSKPTKPTKPTTRKQDKANGKKSPSLPSLPTSRLARIRTRR
jgi:hypothetical protein